MTAPNLTIAVEPANGGSVMFLPLAPKTANDKAQGEVALQFTFTNNELKSVHVTGITVSFTGSPAVPSVMIPLNLNIPAHGGMNWAFDKANDITVPFPAPGHIVFAVTCQGFSQPAKLTKTLIAAGAPVPGGFEFPAKASDLRIAEYWIGQSLTHDTGNNGTQLFAYDMGVAGLDPDTGQLSRGLPKTSNQKNSDARIWGKPIYAVADGTVLESENTVPNNPHPLHWTDQADHDAKAKAQADAVWNKPQFKNPGAGNHFYLQHGDLVVLYAHMQQGSLNPDLLKDVTKQTVVVKRGQFLGLAGNSGSSDGPHLHIHAVKGNAPETGPLRPFPFRHTWVADIDTVHAPDPSAPWVKAADQGLPSVKSLIWPAASKPAWYPPGWAEITRTGIPDAQFQTEFDKVVSSGYRPVWIDGFDADGNTYYNIIFRPADGTVWAAKAGLDSDAYQAEFDARKKAGYRPSHVETLLIGGDVRYAGIWVKSAGPAWSAYHGRTAAEHQNQFDTLTKKGYVPVTVSAVDTSDGRLFTALYEKRDAGGFVLSGLLSWADYQTQTDANIKAGRQPASLNAVSNGDNPLMLGLWEQKASVHFVARHGQSEAQFQAEYDLRLKQGFLTRAISGCDDGNGNRTYAALWSK